MTHESLLPWDDDDAPDPDVVDALDDAITPLGEEAEAASAARARLDADPRAPLAVDEAELWGDAARSVAVPPAAARRPAGYEAVLGLRDADELAREGLADSAEPPPELGLPPAAAALEDASVRAIGTAALTGEDDYLFG